VWLLPELHLPLLDERFLTEPRPGHDVPAHDLRHQVRRYLAVSQVTVGETSWRFLAAGRVLIYDRALAYAAYERGVGRRPDPVCERQLVGQEINLRHRVRELGGT
jgi:hypothetical protein